jgi:hypothetical protein
MDNLVNVSGPQAINIANTGSLPTLTAGGFASLSVGGPGQYALQVAVQGSGSNMGLKLYSATEVSSGVWIYKQIPDSSIFRMSTQTFGAIPAGVDDYFFAIAPGGWAILSADSYTSGTAYAVMSSGPISSFPGQQGQSVVPIGATTWNNGGVAITTPVTISTSPRRACHLSLDNTSSSTTYWYQLFNKVSPTLGTDVPFRQGQVPPGPGGREVVLLNPENNAGTALSIAFTTLPNGSVTAPGSTCYATVDYLV